MLWCPCLPWTTSSTRCGSSPCGSAHSSQSRSTTAVESTRVPSMSSSTARARMLWVMTSGYPQRCARRSFSPVKNGAIRHPQPASEPGSRAGPQLALKRADPPASLSTVTRRCSTTPARTHMEHVVTHHDDWHVNEELAERMIPLIGGLNREHDVVTSLHGHRLLGLSTTGILEVHERVAQLGHRHLAPADTLAVLQALREIGPGASSLDVARLVDGHAASGKELSEYLREELAPALGAELADPVDIVLYGFGRIGRLLARIIIAHKGGGSGLRLRAIVVRRGSDNDLVKRASLLLRDSVHGRFEGTVDVDEDTSQIIANGTRIQVIYSDD